MTDQAMEYSLLSTFFMEVTYRICDVTQLVWSLVFKGNHPEASLSDLFDPAAVSFNLHGCLSEKRCPGYTP